MKSDILSELNVLNNKLLMNDFPHEDIEQIEKDFEDSISEEACLTDDFNKFCMTIAGSYSYVLGKKRIPKYQRQFLYKDFFSLYQNYSFLKDEVSNYPQFQKELVLYEKARELLLTNVLNK